MPTPLIVTIPCILDGEDAFGGQVYRGAQLRLRHEAGSGWSDLPREVYWDLQFDRVLEVYGRLGLPQLASRSNQLRFDVAGADECDVRRLAGGSAQLGYLLTRASYALRARSELRDLKIWATGTLDCSNGEVFVEDVDDFDEKLDLFREDGVHGILLCSSDNLRAREMWALDGARLYGREANDVPVWEVDEFRSWLESGVPLHAAPVGAIVCCSELSPLIDTMFASPRVFSSRRVELPRFPKFEIRRPPKWDPWFLPARFARDGEARLFLPIEIDRENWKERLRVEVSARLYGVDKDIVLDVMPDELVLDAGDSRQRWLECSISASESRTDDVLAKSSVTSDELNRASWEVSVRLPDGRRVSTEITALSLNSIASLRLAGDGKAVKATIVFRGHPNPRGGAQSVKSIQPAGLLDLVAQEPTVTGGALPASEVQPEPPSELVAHCMESAHSFGPRHGRNDPCPCGSGKKYKKCHGAPGARAQ